ncbi:hypothetical protein BI364_13400 [Acidihalobacter yilgarnensis]|uniref:Uncharacterized protein n=1 Tax=Acidihalobacter yilgarnensis TaxID=2819280 RepID=A0A1D8IR19_9GAMM|nr:MbcA/ParS/Xre antitoxin family protein [Acidihalobacter yilgarnensis]AOU98824.1 hypothetical protein BI364_13400 [Acidihalobacter yilgarnensis]
MNQQQRHAEEKSVLAKALFNAAGSLGIKIGELAFILGCDRSTLQRHRRNGSLDPASKSGELSLLLIRVYRDLYALMGGNRVHMQHWLNTENRHLHAMPRQMLTRVEGLTAVLAYLDAMRGKT